MAKGEVKVTKPCARCGEIMEDVAPNRVYCKSCIKIVSAEKAKLWWAAHPDKKKELSKKAKEQARRKKEGVARKPTTVEEIDKLAKAEGLSYGKYVLKYGI